MQDIFIGRQPIFDRDMAVQGYELLFRHGDASQAGVVDGDSATSQVILTTLTVFGLEELVGSHKAFLNLTPRFLIDHGEVPLPRGRVVLEVLEEARPEPELIEALQRLRRAGYQIALDDFVYDPSLEPLLHCADIVKVEVPRLSEAQLREHVKLLQPYGVSLLAEKIESQEELAYCARLGFDYFQGYFLSRPSNVRGSDIPTSRLPILELIAALQGSRFEIDELERLITRDVSLSYKLLRYLNSPFFSVRRRIDSIRQAVVYLGARELLRWAALMSMASVSDKPQELAATLMIRAKLCELLGNRLAEADAASCFTAGMLSGLDLLLDAPMESIVRHLPLNADIEAAVLRGEGWSGRVLAAVRELEEGRHEGVRDLGFDADTVNRAWIHAVGWVEEVRSVW